MEIARGDPRGYSLPVISPEYSLPVMRPKGRSSRLIEAQLIEAAGDDRQGRSQVRP